MTHRLCVSLAQSLLEKSANRKQGQEYQVQRACKPYMLVSFTCVKLVPDLALKDRVLISTAQCKKYELFCAQCSLVSSS